MIDSESTQPTFSGGEVLAGKYRVERVIGQGGMGIVLAAEHLQLNQKVAIKLLRTAALGHTDVVGRFMREARAAVKLRSEHVARVIDVGALDDGRPFIVMEHLTGLDLGDVIDKNVMLPVNEAADYVVQACEAIAEAHAAGIIHRDLKPKNLFLTHAVHGKPLVKVLDFGISKIDTGDPSDMQLTKTTEVIGSPSYMSPEQLRSSRNVDVRTDIWALGVILYELLTLRVPFQAETVTELVLVVVTEKEPPIQSFRPDVPPGLADIVTRCLQKQPEHRFQTVVDLVQALEPYAHGVTASATDRIRHVAHSGRPHNMPPGGSSSGPLTQPAPPGSNPGSQPGSGSGSFAPPTTPSSRVNVHGGTSVAWGETQSYVGPAPVASAAPVPKASRAGLFAGLAAGALFFTAIAVGGGVYYVKRSNAQPPTVTAAGPEGSMPLPPGRKDLPPVATPTPSGAPIPAPTPDPPAASALPDTRKPAVKPATKPAAPPTPAKSSDPKPDDLSNIGRR